MKKTLSVVLALVMCLSVAISLVACTVNNDKPTTKTLTSFTIADDSLTCYVDDTFSADNVKLTLTWSDGSTATKTVREAGASASQIDTSVAGKKTLTVTLEGKTATATVVVKQKGTTPDPTPTPGAFSYYSTSKLPADKKVYVLNDTTKGENYTSDSLFTAQAIQGLFARKETRFYVDSHYMTNGINTDMYYLEQMKEQYGLTVESISLEEAVAKYIAAYNNFVADGTWGTKIPVENFVQKTYKAYVEGQDYSTPGYILYRKGTISVNLAATLAGITSFLPVEEGEEDIFKAMGLVKKFDITNVVFTYRWLFGVDGIGDELNPDGLVHQNYKESNGSTNKFIKDYGICNKFFHVYYDPDSGVSAALKKNIHGFLNPNTPIFGYTYSEDSDVAFFSEYGQFIVPTDYTCNLSFFSAEEFAGQTFKQPNKDVDKPAQSGKHYVAFVVSDGDNATYWQNTATFATNYMNAAGRENDTFPVTWSITPSLADLMPAVMANAYKADNKYNYFCAPVSGQGYINAGNFAAQNNGEYFNDFCSKLNTYMGKADLSVVTVIGGSQQGNLPGVLAGYASCDNVTGGIVYEGSKYFGSVRGGVMWVNGKPFIGPRDSLWETTPAYIAARINTYERDITSIDGYTLVNVHPWSHSYDDIRTIVGMLADDVEVVSVDRLIRMISDNVTDKSATDHFDIPDKNGVSISESYLQEHPSLIPVDPLYNDFLLWEEDWTGRGVTYNSSDRACSNVGAMYKGNIAIAAGSTAAKREFTLPEIDNYWFSFNARGDALDAAKSATFTVYMTVGGERKAVMKNVTVKGVQGTETQHVTGDGWQCFAFPLKQYFADYKGKTCKVEVEVASGDTGIRVDQVRFVDRTLDGAIDQSKVDVYNNQFGTNTEDWMLGEQYRTSQYYWWDVKDRENLEPTNSIQIDCSDGGGDEKRNGNTNMWMAKNYVLPQSDSIKLNFRVTSDNDTGAMIKISMYVNGEYIVLYDWQTARAKKNNETISVNLAELYPDVNFNGAEATIVFEARDGGNNNGVGEACKLHYFTTVA